MIKYSLLDSLIVIGILFAAFFFFRYYPFKRKKKKPVPKYPSAVKRILDDFEEKISL